jgi:UDP-glucose:(heptosyl)LPS alpha-1,3-glucosyltransferase
MRLAVVRQRYTPFGGAERFLENALAALADRNVAVTLYTREWPQAPIGSITTRIVDPFHIGGLWRDIGFARAVCRALDRDRAELVQSHERLACCDIFRAGDGVHAVWLDERLRRAPRAMRLAVRINPHHRYRIATERRMYSSARLKAVICNSGMVRDEIRERFGVADERLHVVYNAVDTDVYSPGLRAHRSRVRAQHGVPDASTLFVFVGSGFERKGVATLIDALALLDAKSHLIVVGHDKHLRRYAERARALGLSRRVTLAGPQADPRPYYGAADAFVLPTLYDPCPNAALEAMACALPIVTSTKSGAAELALAHDAGLVCAAGDAASLAAQLRTLQDAALRSRMGGNARAAVLPLTSSAMTQKLMALYRGLLPQAPERPSPFEAT